MRKRAVVIFGAGASVEYGAASTAGLTDTIEREVEADPVMQCNGAAKAFTWVKETLQKYLQSPEDVQFEQIYHCVHELIFYFEPTSGAVNEFRPLLQPFLKVESEVTEQALRALAVKMIEIIYSSISKSCTTNSLSIDPLRTFLATLRDRYITRIYSTNYDDFVLQAAPDLYTGFVNAATGEAKRFALNEFWSQQDVDSIYHLHGSVRLGFERDFHSKAELGESVWHDDLARALKCAQFNGSHINDRRMDGSSFLRTSIITGLDKLSRLQRTPLSHYYSALAQDAMRADVIFVLGSGLGDLHINTWLREARNRTPSVPVIVVDFWKKGLKHELPMPRDRKEMEMENTLNIPLHRPKRGISNGSGWRMYENQAAVWERGFQSFLDAPEKLEKVMRRLKR